MSTSRTELVERLLHFDAPLAPTLAALREFGWDCTEPLAILDALSVRSVLQRYLSGSLTAPDVEAWADAIECRDDVDYSSFRDIIYELANPLLTRPLTLATAQELLSHAHTNAP